MRTSTRSTVGVPRARRRAAGVLGGALLAVTGAVSVGVQPALAASDTYGRCGHTVTSYGYRLDCRDGSYDDRSQDGSYDETFAIRNDRAVVRASKGHPWVVVSNGYADEVYSTFRLDDGRRSVCVKVARSGALSESVRNANGWSAFHSGCHGWG